MTVTVSGLHSEADLQRAVIDLAQLCGWKVAHFRPARTKDGGWRTAVAGDGKGFPDLVLAKPDRFLMVELKSTSGRLTAEQREWLDTLTAAGIDARIWRPDDFDTEIVPTLRGNR